MTKFKEETDSLDAENVENLTINMKTVCPALDSFDNSSNMETSSDYMKDGEDKENYDKMARKPVESWKYLPLKTEDNRTGYKCSLCTSVYQHKKSLNKHWKDKHNPDGQNALDISSNSSLNESVLPSISTIQESMRNPFQFHPNSTSNAVSPFTNNNLSTIARKRSSICLQNNAYDDDKENAPPTQARRTSFCQYSNNISSNLARASSMLLTRNNSLNIMPNGSAFLPSNFHGNNSAFQSMKPTTVKLESSTVNEAPVSALDLRTSVFRCFQCTFKSKTMQELNTHFQLLHMNVLIYFQTSYISVPKYQHLLFNQFSTIYRTRCESIEQFNSNCSCAICKVEFSTRYEMIQHLGTTHRFDFVWVCLVCGTACNQPNELSLHFQQHDNIQLRHKQQQPPPPLQAHTQLTEKINSLSALVTSAQSPPPPVPHIHNNQANTPSLRFSGIQRHHTMLGHIASSSPIINKTAPAQNNCTTKPTTSTNTTGQSDSNNSKAVLKCLVCDTTARWRSELFTHMITHSEHRSFGCKFCNYRSKWKWDVPKHLKRCRLAPAHVRHPDVQNSYLVTLLQHYSPPPGDILHEFMKEYNIKDIGMLNRSTHTNKTDNETASNMSLDETIKSTVESTLNIKRSPATTHESEHKPSTDQAYSDISEDNSDVDVGTYEFPIATTSNSVDKSTTEEMNENNSTVEKLKPCPWCPDFMTSKTQEMIEHIKLNHA